MFYRVFGRSGSGKTAFILDMLKKNTAEKKKTFLIVPEQSSLIAEKEIISSLSGQSNLYVEVINFKRLCNRVFRETGGLCAVHPDEGAKKLIMSLALEKISPFLKEYKESSLESGFAEKALSCVNELSMQNITTESLEKAAAQIEALEGGSDTANKLYDIALIAESYNQAMALIPDAETDIYGKLCEKLRENDFFGGCDVFFDSFYSFTSKEYEIISLIAEGADNCVVTFCCDKDKKDDIFKRGNDCAKKCKEIAEKCGCEITDITLSQNRRQDSTSSLYMLEKEFGEAILTAAKPLPYEYNNIHTRICTDIYGEAKCALSTVLELVKSGADFSDIAICAKNPDDYMGVLDTVFEKNNVPLGVSIPYTFSETALYELVLSALQAAGSFKADDVLRYVKSGLSGLDEIQADIFEIYVRTWDITPSLFKKDEDWYMNPDGYTDARKDMEVLDTVNKARSKVFICLDSLSKNLKKAQTVKDFSTAVYNLLCDIVKISEKDYFDDKAKGESLKLLYELLDSFVSFAGDSKTTLSRFISLIKSCSSDYDTGRIPQRAKQVQFASVDLIRTGNIKHMILLGANSSVFPSACKKASLLSFKDRDFLEQTGIKLSESEKELMYDELFLAYACLTSPRESCYVLYSNSNLSSEKLFESVIVTVIRKITGVEPKAYFTDSFGDFCFSNELLFEELACSPAGTKRNTLIKYFSTLPQYSKRLENLFKSYTHNEYLESATTRELYGSSLITTYTRLEKFNQCPFSHFCRYTLGLKTPPVARLGPSEAGSVMHKIMEELVPLLCTTDEDGNYPDENTAKELIDKLLREYLNTISGGESTNVPKRFVYLYTRLSKILYEMAKNILGELKVSSFKPCDFELGVGIGNDIPPIPIDLEDGKKLYISGQIDRVDIYRDELGTSYIRVVDYKTGKKLFKLDDIRKGFNLQMLLYLASVCKMGKERYGEKLVPAGVIYSNITLETKNASLGQDDVKELADALSKPVSSGLVLDDDNLLYAMDPTDNSMYISVGRKKGVNTKTDSLASLEKMGRLLDFACVASAKLAKEIHGGLISPSPYNGKADGVDIDGCQYCEMASVCMGEKSKRSSVFDDVSQEFDSMTGQEQQDGTQADREENQ